MGGGRWTPSIATNASGVNASARLRGLLGAISPENRPADQQPARKESGAAVPAATVSSPSVDAMVGTAALSPASWDWEIDDWEFAGKDGDSGHGWMEPLPRVVFGDVPSYEEAQAATAELKEAVEKIGDSHLASNPPLVPELDLEKTMTAVATGESSGTLAVSLPGPAVQAFKLLRESTAAQSIVASIASDPNVWNAVLRNEAFMDLVQSQKTRITDKPDDDHDKEDSSKIEDDDHPSEAWSCSPKKSDEFPNAFGHQFGFLEGEGRMANMVRNIKLSVVEMVTSASTYLQSIFSTDGGEKEAPADTGSGSGFFDRHTLGASFMGLAMLVIMLVLLKRV